MVVLRQGEGFDAAADQTPVAGTSVVSVAARRVQVAHA